MNRQHDGSSTPRRWPCARPIVLWLCLLPIFAPLTAWSQVLSDDPPLLAVEDAFRFSAVPRGPLVRIQAHAQDGYYLYRDRIRLESRTPGVEIGDALLPPGKSKEDPLFGQVQVYRGQTLIDLPLRKAPPPGTPFEIAITSQGCADLGVCYPPDTRILQVTLSAALSLDGGKANARAPTAAEVSNSAPGSVLERLDRAFGKATNSAATQNPFLPVDEAFALRAPRFDANAAVIGFDVAPGYYLYRSRMGFEVMSPDDVRAQTPQMPEGKSKHDAYLGEQQVYYKRVQMRVPLSGLANAATVQMKVRYQGCADAGLCYPPQERVIPISALGPQSAAKTDPSRPPSANGALSETDQLAVSISHDALVFVLGTFFIAGLLLAFTPCVLPMIPILSAIIAGQRDSPHAKSGFALSLVYVLAMSLTYTAAGVLAALFGQNLQALFQHPTVLVGFSLVFVALALAMFGVYELQLPVALQTRLAAFSQRQRAGNYVGVGIMGALSALIVGPCVAAPLAAALIVIGTAGDPLRGGLALFALSLGMGVPLLVVGAFGPRLLPRAGPWMVLVKQLFGVMLLAVAVYLLSRILADAYELALWCLLALLSAVLIFRSGMSSVTPSTPATVARVGLSLGLFACAIVLAIGAVTGAHDPLHPLAKVLGVQHKTLQFQRVKSVAELDQLVAQANIDGRIVMLDFYADWCVSCIEMEHETFIDPAVQDALKTATLIQADVTAYDGADQALLERFGLHGPPAIIFFGRDGQERRELRVIGFMDANEFRLHVTRADRF